MHSPTEYQDRINIRRTGSQSHSYTASWHDDLKIGPAVHGGSLAAIIQMAASLHLSTTLAHLNQPDLLTLHVEFIRMGTHAPFKVNVKDLKIGKTASLIQLHLSQDGSDKAIALATTTNFGIELGPSAETTIWEPLLPNPDFAALERGERQEDWLMHRENGPLFPLNHRMKYVQPRHGFQTAGRLDLWHGFDSPERIRLPHLTMLADMYASMSDTLLRSGAIFDANAMIAERNAWEMNNPGKIYVFRSTLEKAAGQPIWNNTLVLDIEYKRRIPEQGLEWVYTRVLTNSFDAGRLEMSANIYGEDKALLCTSKHLMLVLESGRRYGKKSVESTKL